MSRRYFLSVCDASHIEVWSRTSQLALDFIHADDYIVYVPKHQMGQFRDVTPRAMQVVPEDALDRVYREELLRACSKAGNAKRFGWYLQQFLKISAMAQLADGQTVIWDADCVPVTPLEFFDSSGTPIFSTSDERHAEYFEAIRRLLGIGRSIEQSFVSPGFPFPPGWAREFIGDVQEIWRVPWPDAVMSAVDFSQGSGFSEYETLGTWMAHQKEGSWTVKQRRWERYGTSRFGPIGRQSVHDLKQMGKRNSLDVISFENWDKRNRRWMAQVARRIRP